MRTTLMLVGVSALLSAIGCSAAPDGSEGSAQTQDQGGLAAQIPVTVARSADGLSLTTSIVGVDTHGNLSGAMPDGASMHVAWSGGALTIERTGDQGHITGKTVDDSGRIRVTADDRSHLMAVAKALVDQGQARAGGALAMLVQEGLVASEYETTAVRYEHVISPQSASLCSNLGWSSAASAWVDTHPCTSSSWSWSSWWWTCNARGNEWRQAGQPTSGCFGRCGPGCSDISLLGVTIHANHVYSQACADHDACVRDQGLLASNCNSIFWAAWSDYWYDAVCF